MQKTECQVVDERIALHHQISDEAIENLKAAIVESVEITKNLPAGYASSVKTGGYAITSKMNEYS